MLIRPATVDDAPAIADINVRGWQIGYRGLLPQDHLDGLSVDERTERWRAIIGAGDPTAHQLVAELAGCVVGWTAFGGDRTESGSGELWALYVDPDRWSHGVGAALICAAERALTAAGFDEAVLWVLDGNERADRFYQAHGWSLDGQTRVDDTRPRVELHEHRRSKRLRPQ
ncbi:GNAT family N-acetyltransferase [Gordonia sp. (in: high G+C Gram-positive bacteria)]|uniref:GNAT family N-acetyltransferase n=1 Tax=Gordonia sp. (in: high G+C Gram-positive bacteria) TaxID=84139 RepID=UPI0039E21F33